MVLLIYCVFGLIIIINTLWCYYYILSLVGLLYCLWSDDDYYYIVLGLTSIPADIIRDVQGLGVHSGGRAIVGPTASLSVESQRLQRHLPPGSA